MSRWVVADLEAGRVADALPPWLRERALRVPLTGRVILAVLGDKEIVTSGAVKRLVRKLHVEPATLVVAALGFTSEAEQALLAKEATLIAAGEFHWTDASYQAAHRRGSG